MSGELNFGPYVTVENGKKVVKDLTYGNPTPEGVVLTTLDSAVNWMARLHLADDFRPGLLRDRDDVDGRLALRHCAFRRRGLSSSPRQSDLMIIAGRVSNKMAPVIREL